MTAEKTHWDPDHLLDEISLRDTHGIVFLLTQSGRVLAARGNGLDSLLEGTQSILGQSIDTLFPNSPDNRELTAAHTEALNGEVSSCRHRVGEWDVAWEMSPMDTQRGGEVLALAIILGSSHEAEAESAQYPQSDPVTGLPTGHMVHNYANEAISRDPSRRWALLYVRIEGLKQINHALGQHKRNVALRRSAQSLQSALRADEQIGRLTGDDFIAFIGEPTAQTIIERIQAMEAIFDDPAEVESLHFKLHVTVGIALYPDDGTTASDLERRAAIALEQVRSVNVSYAFFSRAFETQLLAYRWVPLEMKRALNEGQFTLHYQPVWDTSTGATASLEALVRWQHPWRGLLPPSRFVPVIEDMDFIVALDTWVMEQACRDAVEMGQPVSVNITGTTLAASDFLAHLDRILHRTGLSGESLILELTERVFVEPDIVLHRTKKIHERGVRIAVDDFGVGYSSLSSLWQYPLDELKLDGSFVRAAERNFRAWQLVAGLVPLAKTLGLKLVAEGVETKQDHVWLQKAGIYLQQGFYLGRPAPMAEIIG